MACIIQYPYVWHTAAQKRIRRTMKLNHFVNFMYVCVSGSNNEYFGSIVWDKQKKKNEAHKHQHETC